MRGARTILLAAAIASASARVTAVEPTAENGPFPVAVETHRIESFSRFFGANAARHGALEWIGGLEIESRHPEFGGLSGIVTTNGGRDLLMISDTGFWASARLLTDADGRPTGIADFAMAPMRGEGGRSLADAADSEGLSIRNGPSGAEAFVSFEVDNRVLRFDLASRDSRGLPAAAGEPLPNRPADFSRLRWSGGLEAVAAVPLGHPLGATAVAIAEKPIHGETDNRGFILGGPKAGGFTIRRRDDFEITDATFLPQGDLLILERRLSPLSGVSARIRRIAVNDIVPGAIVDGRILLDAGMMSQIDNMEGLALDRDASGATILTLISDDNHSILQRTLLLRFRLVQ